MNASHTVSVLLPIPTEGPYSYSVPEDMSLAPGDYVQVPLGNREVAAVVWDESKQTIDPKKLRPVTHKFDCPGLNEATRRFVEWVANYTLSPPGMVLKMMLRVPAALDPEPLIDGLEFSGKNPERMTGARQQVLEFAEQGLVWTKSGLAHAQGTLV